MIQAALALFVLCQHINVDVLFRLSISLSLSALLLLEDTIAVIASTLFIGLFAIHLPHQLHLFRVTVISLLSDVLPYCSDRFPHFCLVFLSLLTRLKQTLQGFLPLLFLFVKQLAVIGGLGRKTNILGTTCIQDIFQRLVDCTCITLVDVDL